MDFNLSKKTNIAPAAGKLLIAEPLLTDENFSRSVIYICEHGADGTVGFALNRPTNHTLGDLLPELYTPTLPVFQGGPVNLDTLHMLHKTPDIFGGTEIASGIFWGGSYDALQHAVAHNTYQPMDMRLFVGYSGWSAGQLDMEIASGSWMVANVDERLLFHTDTDKLWRMAVQSLGRDFAFLMNIPLNPQLN